MRDTIRCIKKYIDVVDTESFVKHWKKLAHGLILGIQERYQKGDYEPNIVELIKSIVNNIGSFETKDSEIKISTNSVFVHGNKSQVEFEYYGRKTQRELGDIIFILSVVYNGKKYFEKMTITQVKKSNKANWNLSSNSAKEQLYLLSKFPKFRGVSNSLIPRKEYNLPNYSGCLGTHGLLYYPGDFALVSSNMLDIILRNKKQLKLEDLLLYSGREYYLNLHYRCSKFYPLMCISPVLGNSCIAYNAYEFSDKYLRGCIGEMVYSKDFHYNHHAFQFLQDLFSVMRKKAKKENLKGDQGNEGYIEFNYEGEGGGMGIIHTTINLGESE